MFPGIRCIIIDDEPKAIELLKQRLGILFPDLEIKGIYTDWEKGLEAIRQTNIDILFLDMSMPQKSGLDFLKLFPKISFQVIFITAHSEYALDAIKFSAAGYVLKPIDDYELSFAINKAIERVQSAQIVDNKPSTIAPAGSSLKIGIPNIRGIDYLNVDDILYFESVNKYTKVVTKDHSILSSYNLGEFKKLVEDTVFFQVHRSYIINIHHVRRYETSGSIVMIDEMQIPISKNIRNDFMNAFNRISRTVGLKKQSD
jgi:two-component system, LytTR family, response regulator